MVPHLVLIGDSDVAFWPEALYPIHDGKKFIVSGHSGSTLGEIIPFLDKILKDQQLDGTASSNDGLLVVAVAGENDIGNGLSLDDTLQSLERFVNLIFNEKGEESSSSSSDNRHLIFLGPKFEPWLQDDFSSKKKYAKMSRSFHRFFERHNRSKNLHYIDCLTMFCGSSASIPGAVLGGKAKPEYRYFASDLLHLSQHGYKIWKDTIEKTPIFQQEFELTPPPSKKKTI